MLFLATEYVRARACGATCAPGLSAQGLLAFLPAGLPAALVRGLCGLRPALNQAVVRVLAWLTGVLLLA